MASVMTTTATSSATITSQGSQKTLKRKFDDALQRLDEAVGPSVQSLDRPAPPKKLRSARSIYATLSKYGIGKGANKHPEGSDLDKLSKTAPHLAAILSRTATRTRKALPVRFGGLPKTPMTSPSTTEYRPSSLASFLARLATYKLSTYGNKPPAIDAVAASRCGWVNDGKDRLLCGICNVSWVVADRTGMNREAANTLVEKQRVQLVDAHKEGCPWRTRQCDASIYHVPLQSPFSMIKELKARAQSLDLVMKDVEIRHPMTAAQVQSTLATVASVSLPTASSATDSEPSTPTEAEVFTHSQSEPSETAVLAALFGWSMALQPSLGETSKTPSASRAGSVAPSTPGRSSRPPSVIGRPSSTSPHRLSTMSIPQPTEVRADTTLLHCTLCQRRIGLWAFLPPRPTGDDPMAGEARPQKRALDILREHRSHCPYVVRSTIVPSLPAPPSTPQSATHARSGSLVSLINQSTTSLTSLNGGNDAMEGWRAVFTMVMRYGNLQKQRPGLNRVPSGRSVFGAGGDQMQVDQEQERENDPNEAMVAGVKKSQGGKVLLKYVKNLLG